eukprot:TRINITY_DN15683_c0_g1_i1.p1 TRINITY_DN15683_c0_g1~~TRINITY_DN15683_c0_g1_i1.p1  ORF type:complete len:109 (-),score=11.44 TRINITY_DN15683_c0_g1_i1:50-376(-)
MWNDGVTVLLGGWCSVMSCVAFVVMLQDKWYAHTNHWRISERELRSYAWYGGFLGLLLGMLFFQHKTRKWSFWATVMVSGLMWYGLYTTLIRTRLHIGALYQEHTLHM